MKEQHKYDKVKDAKVNQSKTNRKNFKKDGKKIEIPVDIRELNDWLIAFKDKNGRRQSDEELKRVSQFLLTIDGQKELEKLLTRPNLDPRIKEKILQIQQETRNNPQTFFIGDAFPKNVQSKYLSYPHRAEDRYGGSTTLKILLKSIAFHNWLVYNAKKADDVPFTKMSQETSDYLRTNDGQEDLDMLIERTGMKKKIREKLLQIKEQTQNKN